MNLTDVTVETDRDGVIDAVTRMVEGIDFGNEELLASAFTEDVVFDLSGIDDSVISLEPYIGRQQAIERLMATVGTNMDTFHALANIRVKIDGDTAVLTCYLLGEHFRAGQGPSLKFGDNLLLGNRFVTELVRDHSLVWRVRRNTVSSMFALGIHP